MEPQIFSLETKFMYGKHKGKTLFSLIENYESQYIGYLIFYNVSWFIMHPDTIHFLENKGFFDDLDMAYYGNGGSMPLSWVGLNKERIVALLEAKYSEFNRNSDEYKRQALQRMNDLNRRTRRDNLDDDNITRPENIEDNYDEPLDEEEMIMRALENGNGEPLGYG